VDLLGGGERFGIWGRVPKDSSGGEGRRRPLAERWRAEVSSLSERIDNLRGDSGIGDAI
jgi:hypothetical protein